MKQENLKYSNQNINFMEQQNKMNNASNSSLFSPFSSASSSSSSNVSLNTMNQHIGQPHEGFNLNYTVINNLKTSLDQLLSQKTSICKQLEELSKKVCFNICFLVINKIINFDYKIIIGNQLEI